MSITAIDKRRPPGAALYTASFALRDKRVRGDVVQRNAKTVWMRFTDRRGKAIVIKRHIKNHDVQFEKKGKAVAEQRVPIHTL